MANVETVTHAYLVAALWSSTDDNDEPLDAVFSVDDVAPALADEARADVEDFLKTCEGSLSVSGLSDEQIGHDFWLTRNHHGAGFWDRGLPGQIGDALTDVAHAYGEVYLYVGDDGMVHAC